MKEKKSLYFVRCIKNILFQFYKLNGRCYCAVFYPSIYSEETGVVFNQSTLETSELCSINQFTLETSELCSINQFTLETSELCSINQFTLETSELC